MAQSTTKGRTVLTHRGVEALRPDLIAYRVCDLRCRGLAIRVAPTGTKTWDLAYRIRGAGTFKRLSLGKFPEIGLEAARERAAALTKAAQAGRDLLVEEKETQAQAESRITVGQLAELYLSRVVRGRLRTSAEMEIRLKRILLPLSNQFADEVKRKDLRKVLETTVARGTLREAEKQRQLMRVMFRWGVGQDLIEDDPSAGIPSFGASQRRDRVLSADEIKKLWDWLATANLRDDHADALRLQLAIGARIGEVTGMSAREIDTVGWLWTLPAERSKNGRPRVTPLVGIARDIVQSRLATMGDGLLFKTGEGNPLTSNCMSSVMVHHRKTMPIGHFSSHDLRRTVATQLVEIGFSYEVVAAVLGHEVGGKEVRTLIRHYVRTDLIDRKRQALEGWDKRLKGIVFDAAPPPNVTRLADRRDVHAA